MQEKNKVTALLRFKLDTPFDFSSYVCALKRRNHNLDVTDDDLCCHHLLHHISLVVVGGDDDENMRCFAYIYARVIYLFPKPFISAALLYSKSP